MTVRISTVDVRVPLNAPTSKRHRGTEVDDSHIHLEVHATFCRVWDQATQVDCGEIYHYDIRDRHPALHSKPLADMPYFDAVHRHLVDAATANRGDLLGAFLAPAVEAMDAAAAERDGCRVYFARAGNRIKIGWSRRVGARVTELQTGNPEPVRLLATVPGARSLERRLHERFASARVSGEWFDATPELLDYVGELA